MTASKKKTSSAKKSTMADSYWARTAKEIGTAAAMAALPILMNSIAELIEKHTQPPAPEKPSGKGRSMTTR